MRSQSHYPQLRTTVGALIIIAFLLPFPYLARAQALPGLLNPFGGPILAIFGCTLPPAGLLLVIGPPQGGTFLYVPGVSLLFSFFSIRPGAWTLGLAGALAECFTGPSFDPTRRSAGKGGTVLIMGTSL